MNKQQLLPAYVRERLPTFEAIADVPLDEMTAVAKFFYPDFDWTWYAVAFDGEDRFFGLVDGFEAEFGDFSLAELLENHGALGCAIERDRSFAPQPLGPIFEAALERRVLAN